MVTGQVQLFNAGMHEDPGQKDRGRPKKRRHGLSTSRTGFGEMGVMRSTTSQGPKISPLKFISEGVEEGIFAHPQEANNTMKFGTSTQKPPDPGSTMEVDPESPNPPKGQERDQNVIDDISEDDSL